MFDSVNAHIDEIIAENKKKPFFADEETETNESTCTENGSAAAAPTTETTHEYNSVSESFQPIVKLSTQDDLRQRKWFDSGVRAAQRGYGDISPFYENKTADYFFKCGYAGTSFAEAQQVLKEKIQQIMESNPLITEVTNEYASKQI